MAVFLVRRAIFGAAVLLLVSLGGCWFFTAHFYQPLSLTQADPWQVYWHWLTNLQHGSWDHSYLGYPLWRVYEYPLIHTGLLLAITFVLVAVFALVLGTVSAVKSGTAFDTTLRWLSYAAWGMPAFLFAFVLQRVFGTVFGAAAVTGWPGRCYIPLTGGFSNASCAVHGWAYLRELALHLILPSLALAASFIGIHARYVRSSLLVALNSPYVTTARAKGLPEWRVVARHALRTSLVAFVSALLLDFGSMFGAAMAVDWVFQLGGVGIAFLNTISPPAGGAGRVAIDPNAVQFLLVVTAGLVLFMSVLGELVVSWLDPRVRLR